MNNIGNLLYSYMLIPLNKLLHHVLDTMEPSPGSRPALQPVRTAVSPGVSDIRRRGYPRKPGQLSVGHGP